MNKLAAIQRVLKRLGRPALPDLSNAIGIAKLRYIQSLYETQEYRNPDTLIGDFLPPIVRWLGDVQGKLQLSKLRSRPFYYYLIARTKHYDDVFRGAANGPVDVIINVGCGTDTRAYRFAADLRKRNKKVLECDQEEAILIKQKLAQRKWRMDHVSYLSIDLNNDQTWNELTSKLVEIRDGAQVLLEGVSPYITSDAFDRFLKFLATGLPLGSRVAYDGRIQTESDHDAKERHFRLPSAKADIAAYHEALGFKAERIEFGAELSSRLLPNLAFTFTPSFSEDCVLELIVSQR